MKPKIFLLGASGVGKSTLARHIHTKYGLPLLPSATRAAFEKCGGTADQFNDQGDIDKIDEFQKTIWWFQQQIEEEYWQSEETGFVTDRGFDLFAYTSKQSRVVWQIVRSPEFIAYLDRLRLSGQAIVFFVRPHPGMVPKLDGRRDFFLTPEWRHGVDGVIEYILESNEIPYISISDPMLRNRLRTIDTVIDLARRI